MSPDPRLTGEPILRILCKSKHQLVGYPNHWDNGDLQPAWLGGAMTDVSYEAIQRAA